VGEIDGVDIGVLAQAGLTGGNSGLIRATGDSFVSAGETFIASGLDLRGAGSFENKGTITAAVGVNLQGTATLDNTGRVLGVDVGVDSAGDGLIANSGLISESGETFTVGSALLDAAGVFLNGGVLDNSGVVEGAVGVAVESGGTVIDSGTIIGRDFDAVYFASGFNNLLVLSPTAKIEGGVFGGGGTLELEADGKTVGTAAPAQYVGFDDVTIESKAIWDMAGTFVTSLGLNLVNDGTIKESAHDLITISGALDGTGLVELSKQAFTVNGAVAAGEKIAFTGTGETLAIGDAAGFEGVVETFKAGDTIELSGVAFGGITGSHFAGGVLTIDESGGSVALTFASPDSFGKDVFLLSADGAGTAITLVKPKLAILAPALSVGSATVLPELGGDFGKAAAGKAHDLTGLTMVAPGWVPAAVGRVDLGLAVVTLHG
jgi:hypothetical protein